MNNDELIQISNEEPTGFGSLSCERGLLPLEAMDVRASIHGLSASVKVAQTFRNSLSEAMEVTYIFPLPPRAAVSSFQVEIAGRIIDGKIKERGQARREYREAIDAGKRAAITEEDRSGVFTMRAGNIMPGETAIVRLELVGPLAIEDGDPCFRFPLVVAPRYMPGKGLDGTSVGDGVAVDTDLVPDASRISPPVLLKGCKSPIALSLSVDIDSGDLPLSELRSSLHAVVVEEKGGRTCVKLSPGERLDRDFILRFALKGDAVGTQLAICPDPGKQEDGNDGTIALTLVPPASEAPARPRDVVFVLDRSGSMSGWKMVAARRAVGRMLDTLGDRDRYTVLAFDNQIETPANAEGNGLIAASDRNRYRTLEWLGGIDAEGGTEMHQPLTMALDGLAGGYQDRDRMLVLITDGQVGNEDHILRSVAGKLRNVRIFTIGIDRSVNEGFLRRLAVLGGGSCAFVESEDRLDEVMSHIHRRIATPVITELMLVGEGIDIDPESIVPRRLPDLFEAAPIVVRARYRGQPKGAVTLSGSDAVGMPWKQSISAPVTEQSASVHSIWARGRVRDLEDRYAIGSGDQTKLEKEILATSLGFGVLSRFTAFVAVDNEVVNSGGEVASVVQPVESPEGWADKNVAMPTVGAMAPMQAYGGSVAGAGARNSISMQGAPDALMDDMDEELCEAEEAAAAPMESLASSYSFSQDEAPRDLGRSEPLAEAPKKRSKGLFRRQRKAPARPQKKETAKVKSMDDFAVANDEQTVAAYQERIRALLERAKQASSTKAQLQILLQGLRLMLDDLNSVQAPEEFVSAIHKAVDQLRALWTQSHTEEALAPIVSALESLGKSTGGNPPPTSSPERKSFWK
jgi:Ca-activated chloride channel family protein